MAGERITFQVGDYRTLPCMFLLARVIGNHTAGEDDIPFKAEYTTHQYEQYQFELSRDCLHRASVDAGFAIEAVSSWTRHMSQFGYYLQFEDDVTGDLFKRFHSHTELVAVILTERLHIDAKPLWNEFEWMQVFKRIQSRYRRDPERDRNYAKHEGTLNREAKRYSHGAGVNRMIHQAERYVKVQTHEWGSLPSILNVTAKAFARSGLAAIFYSYSHKDQELRDQLENHLSSLQRNGKIDQWHYRRIGAGEEWRGAIDEHLKSADIILLLISADFLASDYCYDVEMGEAMRRHRSGEAVVIPVFLRSVDWEGCPFEELQGLPVGAKPVTEWPDRDVAFTNIAKGIRSAVTDRLLKRGVATTH